MTSLNRAAGLALVGLLGIVVGCSDSRSRGAPDTVTATELTGFIEAVNARDGFVRLGLGPPLFDAHFLPDSTFKGISGLAELEERIRTGSQVKAHVRFVGDYTYNPSATSLEVLDITTGSRWHWRAPLSFRFDWHGWVLMGPDKHYFWIAPWTTFGADSDYRTLEELTNVQSVCADIDASQTVPDYVGYRATSVSFHRSAVDCSQIVGTPME